MADMVIFIAPEPQLQEGYDDGTDDSRANKDCTIDEPDFIAFDISALISWNGKPRKALYTIRYNIIKYSGSMGACVCVCVFRKAFPCI